MNIYPLVLFPTLSVDPEKMDSRRSLPLIMALMKNTIIRGLNNIYRIASMSKMTPRHPDFRAFIEYVTRFCGMLQLHFKGDVLFFTQKNSNGISLSDILSPSCIPSIRVVEKDVDLLMETIGHFGRDSMLDRLESLGRTIADQMNSQLASVNCERLISVYSDQVFRGMIISNMNWFGANSDISFLLPFIVTHHDPNTSPHWPTFTGEGRKAFPELVHTHSSCWKFALFHPSSRKRQLWKA